MTSSRKLDLTEARIGAAMRKWITPLGLGWWRVTLRHYAKRKECKRKFGDSVAARCYADWRYMEAVIEINLPLWVDKTDDEVERMAVHELMHILVNEMREGAIEHEERVVTTLTKAVFWIDAAARGEE
jgi:predicted SprT family Zn-dependent metalloprotease